MLYLGEWSHAEGHERLAELGVRYVITIHNSPGNGIQADSAVTCYLLAFIPVQLMVLYLLPCGRAELSLAAMYGLFQQSDRGNSVLKEFLELLQRTWSCRRGSGTCASSWRTWTPRTWRPTSTPATTSSRRPAPPDTVRGCIRRAAHGCHAVLGSNCCAAVARLSCAAKGVGLSGKPALQPCQKKTTVQLHEETLGVPALPDLLPYPTDAATLVHCGTAGRGCYTA